MTQSLPDAHIERSAAKPARRSFLVLLVLLVAVWAVAMTFRWELRARWWAWQITRSESRETRSYYLTRLASIRDKSLGAVQILLDDSRPDVREASLTVLRYCESGRAADRLLTMLGDESPDVAGMAATTLAWRPDSRRYVGQLETLLDRNGPPQWGAAVALGRIGGAEPQSALTKALRQAASVTPPEVRAQIIDSLGLSGCRDPVCLNLMTKALEDHRPIGRLPYSQMSARRAIAALQSDLRSRGMDPAAAMAAAASPPTVAGVAAHWLALLANENAEIVATQPASPAP